MDGEDFPECKVGEVEIVHTSYIVHESTLSLSDIELKILNLCDFDMDYDDVHAHNLATLAFIGCGCCSSSA
eukprot:SAG31_NODE_166_length_21670_cov_22.507719_9_plen_71_part_00